MTYCGSISGERALVRYALKDHRNKWNYVNMVHWAIYSKGKSTNLLREGSNSKGQLYSFGGIAEDGEIFDRFRTLCEDKPPCGLHYALLSLRGLTYCAHLIAANNLDFFDDIRVASPYYLSGNALIRALHLYGQFFIEFPAKTRVTDIAMEPYRGQQLDESALAAYLLALDDLPRDNIIADVVMTNFLSPTRRIHSAVNITETSKAATRKGEDFTVLQHPHPITTPLSYLILVQAKELEDVENVQLKVL